MKEMTVKGNYLINITNTIEKTRSNLSRRLYLFWAIVELITGFFLVSSIYAFESYIRKGNFDPVKVKKALIITPILMLPMVASLIYGFYGARNWKMKLSFYLIANIGFGLFLAQYALVLYVDSLEDGTWAYLVYAVYSLACFFSIFGLLDIHKKRDMIETIRMITSILGLLVLSTMIVPELFVDTFPHMSRGINCLILSANSFACIWVVARGQSKIDQMINQVKMEDDTSEWSTFFRLYLSENNILFG